MKNYIYLVVCFVFVANLATAQGSDCASAQSISVGSSCVSTAYSANDNGTLALSQCGTGTGYEDGWYQFTASDINTTITVDSDAEDFMIALFESSCGGTVVHCENVVGGNSTTINLTTTIGTDYFIQLQRTSANGNGNSNNIDLTGTLCVYSVPQVCDDLVINSTTFSQSGLTTCGSGDDLSSSDACGSSYMNGEDFVIEYTPSTTECIEIALTNTDSWTGVFLTDECPNSGTSTCLGSATSSGGNPTLGGMNVTAGQTYYITVSTYPSPNCTPFDIDVTACPPPPANDDCSNAITVPVNADDNCGSVTAGTINNATASSQTNDCFGTANDDVWYEFTATSTVHYIDLLNISGSPTDMYHSVYQSNCGSIGSAIECSDPNGSTVTGLTPGDSYFIRIYSYSSSAGANTDFDLCVGTPPPPPANDECSGAISVTVNPDYLCGSVTSGSLSSATASSQTNDCFGTANDDVWYEFTATNSSHTIDLNNVSGSTTDLYHSVYQSNCGSIGSALECSDPNSSTVTGLTPGDSYFIRIYSYSSSSGANTNFDLCVGTPPPPPANDDCSGAIAVTVNTDGTCSIVENGSLGSATASSQTNDCGGTANDDVWYSFIAQETSQNINLLDITGSTTDMYFSVYEGSCGSPGAALLCSDDNFNTVTGLTIGNQYFVRVYSWSSSSGATSSFDLCISNTPPEPDNITCGDMDPICSGSPIAFTASSGGGSAPAGNDYDCLSTQPNPTWFYLEVDGSGDLSIDITAGSDVDYAIWGPFSDLATAQSNCGSFLTPSDCSYSTSATEQANITNVNAGEVYVLLVTNYANVVQSIFVSESSSNTASTDCSAVPLPVELIDFTAQLMGEKVLLSWSTASERSCDYYEIQRSTNGQVWETVGFKEGNGNTNMISKYTYSDAAPFKGISYYRLKQYDFDGAFEFLPIRSVQFMNDEEAISLYPNPAKNSVKVSAVKFKIDKIVVHSSTGKAVRTIQDIDEEIISIDVNQIPAGVYFIEVRTQDGSTHRRRLVIY